MAHSYVDYDGRFVRLSDGVIELVRHFLKEAADTTERGACPAGVVADFQAFIAAWQDFGPGIYSADFGQFVKGTRERREFLVTCLRAAEQRVLEFGSEIPLQYLQALPPHGSICFNGFPVRRVADALGELEALVSGTGPDR